MKILDMGRMVAPKLLKAAEITAIECTKIMPVLLFAETTGQRAIAIPLKLGIDGVESIMRRLSSNTKICIGNPLNIFISSLTFKDAGPKNFLKIAKDMFKNPYKEHKLVEDILELQEEYNRPPFLP